MPVGEFVLIHHWDSWLAAMDRSDRTRRSYSYWVYRFLSECRPESLALVAESDVAAFVAALGRSPAKACSIYALRSFFGYAFTRGFLLTNPTALLKPKTPHKPPVRALRREELARMLMAAHAREPRRGWTLMLCYALGVRRSELVRIRPEDVEAEAVIVHGKGGKIRRVEVGEMARIALHELERWSNGTVVGGLHPQTVTAWAKQAAMDAGLEAKTRQRSAHILRASFATRLLKQGTPISVVSELLGHSDVAITSRYLAVEQEDRQLAVTLL